MPIPVLILLFSLVCIATKAQKPDAIKEYNAGLQYYNMHNYQAAAPFFESAVKKDPDFVYAYRVLIACHEQMNQLEKAVEWYEKVVVLTPSDKQVCYNLALTYLELKDYNKAISNLEKALHIDPAYAKASDKLQQIKTFLQKQTKTEQVAEVETTTTAPDLIAYQKALDLYKKEQYQSCINTLESFAGAVNHANFYYLKAIAYQHEGQRPQAIEAYEQTLELDDRHFNANLNLGKLYYNDRNFEESVHLLETAYMRRKNDYKLLHMLSKAYFYNKEYKITIEYLEKYLQRDSDLAEAWKMLGDAYSNIGKSKNAAEAYKEAQKHGGRTDDIEQHLENHANEYGKKASEYTKSGNYQQAINILEQAIAEHSETASLHFNLGLNYMEVGNTKKAREEFKKTIELEPAHAKAYQGLGLIYYEREEYKEAAAYYLATIDAGKHDEFVHYKLASCYFKMKRFDDATEQFQKAVDANLKEKRYHYSLGLSLLYAEEYLKSIQTLRQTLVLDPDFLDAQYHICVNYIKISEYKQCIAEAEKILKRADDYAKAYLIIGHAYKRMGDYLMADKYQKKAERLDPSLRQ